MHAADVKSHTHSTTGHRDDVQRSSSYPASFCINDRRPAVLSAAPLECQRAKGCGFHMTDRSPAFPLLGKTVPLPAPDAASFPPLSSPTPPPLPPKRSCAWAHLRQSIGRRRRFNRLTRNVLHAGRAHLNPPLFGTYDSRRSAPSHELPPALARPSALSWRGATKWRCPSPGALPGGRIGQSSCLEVSCWVGGRSRDAPNERGRWGLASAASIT
eukprot:352202-Chlamydomonas_euryale.AAC.2